MRALPRELIREFIASENFQTTEDVLDAVKEMFSYVLEEILETEMDTTLGYNKQEYRPGELGKPKNYRNGHTKKTIKTQIGEIQIKVPRDRNGEFRPQIIEKYSRNVNSMEEKILSLYSMGMSQRDIAEQIKSLYSVEISPELVSKIISRIQPQITKWQSRDLHEIYPLVFIDAIPYRVRENGHVVDKDAYVALGINLSGYKEILGIWIRETDSNLFWASVMNGLKSRGVKLVHLFCVDGLSGIRESIRATYPKARIQRCIMHQIRSSAKYVGWKDNKAFTADLKCIYKANNENEALLRLRDLSEKWSAEYPLGVKSWGENWDILRTYFDYPPEIRKIIYTTNILGSLHCQYRKSSKNRRNFPNDSSFIKILYLTIQTVNSKWTKRLPNWDGILTAMNHKAA